MEYVSAEIWEKIPEDIKKMINWNKQKNEIKNFVRGLSPYPAAHALLKNGDEEILDLKIFEVEIEEKNDCDVPDFKVITDGKSFLKVVLRDGFVKILKIQLRQHYEPSGI